MVETRSKGPSEATFPREQRKGADGKVPSQLLALDEADALPLAKILYRYRKLGAQLADAALLHLAEREGLERVFTLDRRDFSIYRLPGNRTLQLLPQ
jgi:predicted nucleic acid-binding protein